MNANVYSFPAMPSGSVAQTVPHDASDTLPCNGSNVRENSPQQAHASYSNSAQIQRFEQLEFSLRNSQSDASLRLWLDEYLDIGLELADIARRKNQKVLQESWLKRVYCFMRDTAFRQNCRPIFRHYCLEYLYQPYFALRHVYQFDDNGDQKIRRLNKDLDVIARYVL